MALSIAVFANAYAADEGIRPANLSTQQEIKVTGTVTNMSGETMPGVNVTIEGTAIGVVTDMDGKYTITVPNEKSVLVFSFVGYTPEKVVVEKQTKIDMVLVEDIKALSEVVVTALGIKKEKKVLGYATTTIKGDDLVKSGTPINPLTSLYGKAAGLRISQTSGGPSAGMIINIRNSVSLSEVSSTRPLFVVDGIPIFDENTGSNRNDRDGRDRGTGINDINAEDIASIEILKGAKAAVLYGSSGANGVVLITTKTGSKSKGLGVDLSLSNTWDNIAYYPEYQNEFGTGSNVAVSKLDPANVDADGFKYETVDGKRVPVYSNTNQGSFGPKMDGRMMRWYDGVMRPYSPQPDNYKDLFRTGNYRSVNFAVSNSGELGNIRFSYTNKYYKSTVLGADQQNHNVSISGNLKTGSRINLGFSTNYYYTFNHNAPYRVQDAFVTYGIARDFKADLALANIADETGKYPYLRNAAIYNQVGSDIRSIHNEYLWNQTQNTFDEKRHHLIQSVNFDYKIAKWLTWTTLSGFDLTLKDNEVKKKVDRPIYDKSSTKDEFYGYYSRSNRNIMDLYLQSYLNFDKPINSDFHLSGMVGTVYKYNFDKDVSAITKNFQIENFFHLGNSTDVTKVNGNGSRGSDILYSVLGSAQLAFKNYLFAEISGRQDWSSILPPANNSYFYPGVSLSWITSETFELPEVIKYFKTRLSWADVGRPGPRYFGNQNFETGTYAGIPYLIAPSDLPPADYASVTNKLPKENLKPERKREIEAGFEIYFFNRNRLKLDLAFYRSNTYNQIMALDVPAASGVNRIKVNAGEIQNTGVEAQITGTPLLTKDFSWEVTLNISSNNAIVKKLAKGVTSQKLWGITGANARADIDKPYGEVYITPWLRDSVGNLIVSSTGLYQFDRENPKKVGKITPDVIGGLSSTLNYKGISLGFDIDYQFGGILISQTNMYMKGNGTGKESLKYRDEARGGLPYYVDNDGNYHQLASHSDQAPTDSKYNFIFHDGVVLPGVKADGSVNNVIMPAQNYYINTYWQSGMDITEDCVYKSDYINLRRVTLSYTLPSKLTQNLKIQRVIVTAFATNLMYIYKDVPNVTPESYAGTNEFTEYSNMPGIRSFGMELKMSF
jgi:iron complex outermembrane receptor protein